jgi:leader peptidase (prepilin peptidase) / N-methyltransferase
MVLLVVIALIIGLAAGSFLGACVYRIPRGISLVKERSFCPHCKVRLKWRDIIPLLGPVLSAWHCRSCGERISGVYSLIEAVTALVFGVLVLDARWNGETLTALAFALTVLPVIWIDREFLVIPNGILATGAIAALMVRIFTAPPALAAHLADAGLAILSMLLVQWLGALLFRKPALGMGDVKLSGFIAFQIGLTGFFAALWLAATGALVYTLFRPGREVNLAIAQNCGGILAAGDNTIPLGSFLSLSSLVVLFAQDSIKSILETWLIWIS